MNKATTKLVIESIDEHLWLVTLDMDMCEGQRLVFTTRLPRDARLSVAQIERQIHALAAEQLQGMRDRPAGSDFD